MLPLMGAESRTGPEQALAGSPVVVALSDGERRLLFDALELVEVAPGETIVREGDHDRAMFFVVSGQGRMMRGGLDLGAIGPGEHFGELALVAERARAASIVAVTRLELAQLALPVYKKLCEDHPAFALHLLTAVVGGLATRLVEMTESVGTLLRERSLPRRTQVSVRLGEEVRLVATGTRAIELLPRTVNGRPVVAALVDRKAVSLTAPLSSDCHLSLLTTAHWEGQRIYRHSLGLLLLEAGRDLDPGLSLRLGHSVGFAQHVFVDGSAPPREELSRAVEARMQDLAAAAQPLLEEWWTVDEARDHFAAAGWQDAAALLGTWRDPAVPLVSYGRAYALNMGPMLSSTGRLEAFRVLPDDDGLLLMYGPKAGSRPPPPLSQPPADDAAELTSSAMADAAMADEPPPSSSRIVSEARAVSHRTTGMTMDQARWLATLDVTSVGAFNSACIGQDVSQLIRVSEGFQEKRITRIADEIRDRGGDIKVVTIAGPSSSGKTTFIKRLRVQLQVNGINPVGLSLDDYYVDRELNPRDAKGDYDFEAFEALRSDLLQEHLASLLAGHAVHTAHYDFQTGRSAPGGGPEIRLGSKDLLMLEGIHGLNPRLLASVPEDRVFRIFICPLMQLPFDRLTRLHSSDVRLIRRIVRDRHARGTNAADNILRWPSVRAGERKHIFPFQHHADAVFDSSLLYELSVLKVYAERYLLEVPDDGPAYTTAFRLLQLVDRFITIYPDHVPPTSLLREFIGGSGFEY